MRVLSVDEAARAKGHDYVAVVYDLDSGGLLWARDALNATAVRCFWPSYRRKLPAASNAVSIDRGPVYQAAVRRQLPNAMIVFDRFHIMKLYNGAIRKVRKTEFRKAGGKAVRGGPGSSDRFLAGISGS